MAARWRSVLRKSRIAIVIPGVQRLVHDPEFSAHTTARAGAPAPSRAAPPGGFHRQGEGALRVMTKGPAATR